MKKILWEIKWFFFSIWIKLTCKMPSKYILTMTFPKHKDNLSISGAYTNLVYDPPDYLAGKWEPCNPDIKTSNFDTLHIGGSWGPEINTTYHYLKVYEYHKLNYYNIKLGLFDYIIKNSRMLKPKVIYDSRKDGE